MSVCLQDRETCHVLADGAFMCTRVCVSEELVFRRKVLRSHEAQDKHPVCVAPHSAYMYTTYKTIMIAVKPLHAPKGGL